MTTVPTDRNGRNLGVGLLLADQARGTYHRILTMKNGDVTIEPAWSRRTTFAYAELAHPMCGLQLADVIDKSTINTSGMLAYQKRVVQSLAQGHRALFTPYGSAKTWAALTQMATLVAAHEEYCATNDVSNRRLAAIIFCKKRNVGTWMSEIALRYPQYEPIDDLGGMTSRDAYRRDLSNKILVVSWTQVARMQSSLMMIIEKCWPLLMVADESTSIKTPTTAVSKAALALASHAAKSCGDTCMIAMAGKPAPEKPEELWAQFEWCWPGNNPLGRTYYAFLRRWFQKTDYSYVLKLDSYDEFYRTVRRFSIELAAHEIAEWQSALGIRKVINVIETFEESPDQRKLLDYLYENWALPPSVEALGTLPVEMDDVSTDEEFNNTMAVSAKAQQISSGFYYDADKKPVYFKRNPKLLCLCDVLDDRLKDDPHRQIVVWHLFRAERGPMEHAIWSTLGIKAAVGPSVESLGAFASGQARIILMPATTTQGFNELVRADTNIFYSCRYSAELRDQALARLERLGQQSEIVTHIDICSDRMLDRQIVQALHNKSLDVKKLRELHLNEQRRLRHVPD